MLDPQLVSNIIYAVQAAFGLLAIHGITYRILAVDTQMRAASGNEFFQITSHIKQGKPFQKKNRWRGGWLNRMSESTANHELSSQIEGLYIQSQAYLSVITMVAAVETLFGLLGTVAGFIVSESIDSISNAVAEHSLIWAAN